MQIWPRVGIIYIWRDSRDVRFYLGSHLVHLLKSEDKYICSSKPMLLEYYRRPEDFKRRIIFRGPVNSKRELLQLENRWLNLIPVEEVGRKYYNLMTPKIATRNLLPFRKS